MSTSNDLKIRTMRREELAFAIDLAAAEGWNPGLHDAECFHAADPGGYLMGELDGEPVGCISAVSYGGHYGFIGLYIVRPEFRGRGMGWRIWRAAMQQLRGHNIGLDGVVAQQGNYAKSGFRLAYRNVRYRAQAVAGVMHASIAPASANDFDAIRHYDRQVFPAPRDAFLRCWLTQPLAGVWVARDGARLTGYAVVRRCLAGWKMGPLAADDAVVARRLWDAALMHVAGGDEVFVDIPQANSDAQTFMAGLGLIPVFETARMYTGPDPAIQLGKLFGVTTFELG
jgi:GNAT superfamily N-acetyltransferase